MAVGDFYEVTPGAVVLTTSLLDLEEAEALARGILEGVQGAREHGTSSVMIRFTQTALGISTETFSGTPEPEVTEPESPELDLQSLGYEKED